MNKKAKLKAILGFLLFNLSFSLYIVGAIPATAQTATGSSQTQEEVDPEVLDSVKKRVEKTVEKVKGIIDSAEEKAKKRAFFGSLKNVTTSTLLIDAEDEVKQASFSAETKFVGEDRDTIQAEDLAVGDYLIAMGYVNGNDVLDTARVVVVDEPDPLPKTQVLWGEITQIDNSRVSFANQELTIKNSLLSVRGDNEAELEDVDIKDLIFVLTTVDEDNDVDQVLSALVVPQKNGLEINTDSQATPEAEVEPTDDTESTASSASE